MWCLLTAHIEWHKESHRCDAMQTQITNSFNFRFVGNQSLSFLDSSATFFWVNGRTFFGRALSRWQVAFFRPLYFLLDAFLKKCMELPIYWKSYVRYWRKSRNFMLFNVIKLYVTKSWWKIKFNKRKLYHQLFCLFVCLFFSIKPTLKSLG